MESSGNLSMSDPQLVLESRYQTVKYFRVAPTALWLLDYFLTFEDEARFMQTRRWTLAHGLFLITRYIPLVFLPMVIYDSITPNLPAQMCVAIFKATGCLLLVIMMATEGLLLLRTLALWHGNKKVRVALLSVYSMLFLAVIVVGGVTVTFHVVVPAPSYCLSTAINPYATGIFSGIMFFELMVLWLTIYYEVRLRSAGLTPIGQLAIALARGNMLYALSLFLMSLANVIVFALPVNLGVSELFDVFQAVIHSIMASRILFKLRKAGTNDDTELSPLSDLRFESGETFSSPPLSPSE